MLTWHTGPSAQETLLASFASFVLVISATENLSVYLCEGRPSLSHQHLGNVLKAFGVVESYSARTAPSTAGNPCIEATTSARDIC